MVKQLEFPFTILRFTEIMNMHKYFQLERKKRVSLGITLVEKPREHYT